MKTREGFARLEVGIEKLIAERNALRNELAAVKAASRHRFTASEVASCIEFADEPESVNCEETARALNELMQNEENYKDVLPELLAVLKRALQQTGCDGDLCLYEWHEDARKIIAKAEANR